VRAGGRASPACAGLAGAREERERAASRAALPAPRLCRGTGAGLPELRGQPIEGDVRASSRFQAGLRSLVKLTLMSSPAGVAVMNPRKVLPPFPASPRSRAELAEKPLPCGARAALGSFWRCLIFNNPEPKVLSVLEKHQGEPGVLPWLRELGLTGTPVRRTGINTPGYHGSLAGAAGSFRHPAPRPGSPPWYPRKRRGGSGAVPRGTPPAPGAISPRGTLALAPTACKGKILKIKPESEELKDRN